MPRPTWKERFCPNCKKESREKIYARRSHIKTSGRTTQTFIPIGRRCSICGAADYDE